MRLHKKLISALVCAATAAGTMSAPLQAGLAADEINEAIANSSGLDIDFARALQYSIYFYDANMCGNQVDENTRYTWRGDCHTYDSQVPMQPMADASSSGTNLSQAFMDKYKDVLDPDGDGYIDVAGGFHDAGDHVKFGIPENYAAATLGWGYYEFRDSYVTLGQDDHIETILRYFNDYLMKCTFRDTSGNVIAHCYQVGEGHVDHAKWNSPEVDSMARPAWFLTADKPQTDYVVSAAGSLAINYLNFKDTDPEYAAKSLDYAKALWQFANDNPKQLSDNSDGPMEFYNSGKWEDDFCWAAAWLYLCTEDKSYLETAAPYVDYYAPSGYCFNWNDMWAGANSIWGVINQEHPELDLVNVVRQAQGKNEYVFKDFWDEVAKCLPTWQALETPGGYAFLSNWGSARYNTAMQLIGLVYDKYTNNGKPGEFSDWAKSQMEYIMGDNPLGRSYIVGYNADSAKFPHHRAASGLTASTDTGEHRYVLFGALVGGPNANDEHNDITDDYYSNEVTIDYNAAFVGACAGLYEFYGTEDMAVTTNFPPAPSYSSEGGGNGFWVDAYAVDDKKDTGAGVTKLAIQMRTDSTQPKTDLSMRYYFSIEEFNDKANISLVEGKELYDQASVEAAPADGILSGPYQYDASFDPNIYYVEVKWDDYVIANSNKKYQFTVGFYWGDIWDPSNDWSYQGITKCADTYQDGSESRTDYICVYSDGVLVGGIEPDGTTVAPPVEETTTTTTNVTTTTTTTTSTPQTELLYGDANDNGEVEVADAVLILQGIADPGNSKYELTDIGRQQADVDGSGSADVQDAFIIQQYKAELIGKLPYIA